MLRLLGLLSLVALVLAGCKPPNAAWHQKLTLVVETPTSEVTASSISAMRVWIGPKILADVPNFSFEFIGEATFVEVAPGRYLFALISNGPGWASDTFARETEERDFPTRMRMIERQRGAPAKEIPRDGWPMMVTFDDVTKPETVREVDPEDLDATFGCAKTTHVLPWRKEGVKYRDWAESERRRLWREKVADRAGLTGPAAKALIEYYGIVYSNRSRPADEPRAKELRKLFSADEEERWDAARRSMLREPLPTVPTAEMLAEMAGGQCYRIKAVTLEITKEPITVGPLDELLPWLESYPEAALLPKIDPTDWSLKATLRHGDFIRRPR